MKRFGLNALFLRFCAIGTVALATFLSLNAHAQSVRGIVSPEQLDRFGLQRKWHTQVQIDRSRSRLTHLTQHVSPTRAVTLYEVYYAGEILEFSEKQTDTFGDPLGKEKAKALALKKVEDLKADHAIAVKNAKPGETPPEEPRWDTRVVPEITLYAVSDSALLQSLDGETGRTHWAKVIGNPAYPTFAAAANDEVVVCVNGSTLFVLDTEDGKEIYRRTTDGVPGASPAISELYAHIPMVSGMMESYNLAEKYDDIRYYRAYGRNLSRPLATNSSLAWTTDRGHMYVGHADKTGIRFRLDANDSIASSPVFLPPNMIVATSTDGFCYCVHEFRGDILWRFSTGQPISEGPAAIAADDAVYVVTDENVMYKVNTKQREDRLHSSSGDPVLVGEHIWAKGGIYSFLGASDKRVYCMGASGRMTILDAKTGGRIGILPIEGLDIKMRNLQTDRMFVGSSTGFIQCIHEKGNKYPVIHTGVDEELAPAQEVKQDDPAKPVDPAAGGGDDPFAPKPPGGGGDDPFAPKPGGGGDDPFAPAGGGDDPFAPKPGGGGGDPFAPAGGGDDPFAPKPGGAFAPSDDDPFAPK